MGKVIQDDKIKNELWQHAQDLKQTYAQRDIDFTEYERMYLMKFPEGVQWRDWKNEASCRPTLSPSARNKIDGALRLLLSQQPIFHVESQKEDLDDEKIEEIENSLARCWELSSTIGGKQTHYNMMLSALLYDEMHTAITPTAELASKNKKDMRIKRIAERTPLLFESWNPHQGYPEFDTFGLCFYYRETQEDWRSVKNKYADILDGKFDNMRYGNATVSIAYDLDYFGVWIDRQCVYLEEHGLSAIPVDVTLVNGSSFFDKPEEQRQPMLYSIHKSKLWERESAMLTVMYTQMFSLGLAPMFVHRSKTGDPLNITMNTNGIQTIQLEEGESFDIISSKGIIPPEVETVMQKTGDMIDASTMYDAAFGEKTLGSSTFSETSLLAQSARLPLIGPQRMGGFGISAVMELALMTLREKHINFNKNGINLKGSELPDDLKITVTLDVILPHERLQSATIAKTMVDNRFISKEYAQNIILGVTDTGKQDKQIYSELATDAIKQQKLQSVLAKLAQAEQQEQAERQQRLQTVPPAQPEQPMQPEQQPMEQPQQPPMTGAGLGQEALDALYQNAMPQAPQQNYPEGMPPAMGGMIPGQTGLAGTANEGMILQ